MKGTVYLYCNYFMADELERERRTVEADVAAIQAKILEELARAMGKHHLEEAALREAAARVAGLRVSLDACAVERQRVMAATAFYQQIERLERIALQEKQEHAAVLERRRRLFGISTDDMRHHNVDNSSGMEVEVEEEEVVAEVAVVEVETEGGDAPSSFFRRQFKAVEAASYKRHCLHARKMKEQKAELWAKLEAAIVDREDAKRACALVASVVGVLKRSAAGSPFTSDVGAGGEGAAELGSISEEPEYRKMLTIAKLKRESCARLQQLDAQIRAFEQNMEAHAKPGQGNDPADAW